MFGLYALGNDERSSTISRRYRVLIGASAAIGIVLSKVSFGIAHGFPGTTELIHLTLSLLARPQAALAQLLHQPLELLT